jgi:hypothetical protein
VAGGSSPSGRANQLNKLAEILFLSLCHSTGVCAIRLTIQPEKGDKADATGRLERLKNLAFAKELDTGIPSQRAFIELDAAAARACHKRSWCSQFDVPITENA